MYRLSEDLAKQLLKQMKSPEFESSGNTAFLPKNLNSIGIIDPICCIGTMFHYILECPKPLIYPDLPANQVNVNGYFLYRKDELKSLEEPFEISRHFVDPTTQDPQEVIDVHDAAIVIPSDIEKLTAETINTLDRLIDKEPLIIDCLNMEKKDE